MVERCVFHIIKEEDRIVPDMEFGLDRAKKEGLQLGRRQACAKASSKRRVGDIALAPCVYFNKALTPPSLCLR